jgi:hypothetical protein
MIYVTAKTLPGLSERFVNAIGNTKGGILV